MYAIGNAPSEVFNGRSGEYLHSRISEDAWHLFCEFSIVSEMRKSNLIARSSLLGNPGLKTHVVMEDLSSTMNDISSYMPYIEGYEKIQQESRARFIREAKQFSESGGVDKLLKRFEQEEQEDDI